MLLNNKGQEAFQGVRGEKLTDSERRPLREVLVPSAKGHGKMFHLGTRARGVFQNQGAHHG